MATGKSGYFDIAGTLGFTVRIEWAEEYDILTNTSSLSIINVKIQSTLYSGSWFPDGDISVDGNVVKHLENYGYATHSVYVNANENWVELESANVGVNGYDDPPWSAGEIVHNSDGSKNVTFTVDLSLWRDSTSAVPRISGSYTISLTTIPRVSSLEVSNGTLGTAQTLTVTQQSTSFTHTIAYTCGTATGTICTKSSSTSISWTPPLALAAQNTTGTSVTVVLTIETFSGSTSIGTKEYTITCAIPSSVKPTVSIATSDPEGYLATFGGYVQNQSTCKVVLTASGNQGSTIKSYSIICGKYSSSKSSATFSLPTSGTIEITAKVTDSRGRTATVTENITVLEYSSPTVTVSAYRSDSSGNASTSDTCICAKFTAAVTPLSDINSKSYLVQYRKSGASDWTDKESSASGYTPTDILDVIEFEEADWGDYEVRVVVTDSFTSVSSAIIKVVTLTLMHLDKSNNRIGLGKVAEGTDVLDVALDAHFRGDVTMDVPLSLTNGGLGTTSLDEAKNLLGISVQVVTTAGTDLNDYTKAGWYFFPSSYTPTNVPAGSNGWLQVIDDPENTNSNGFTKQIWYRAGTPGTNDHQTYVRTYAKSTGWGTWKQYYATDIPDLIALNLNHITDSNYYVNSGDDLDNYTTPGAYRISTSTIAASLVNGPVYGSAGGRLIVTATSTGSAGLFQLIIFNTSNYQIWYRIRTSESAWGKWQSMGTPHSTYSDCRYIYTADGYEWFNPPMVQNTEYRTTERWNNKVVYTMFVSCGAMTNNGTFTYTTETVYPIRFAGYTDSYALPVLLEDGYSSTWKLAVNVKNNVITAFVGSSWSSPKIYVQVWYTK